MKRRRTAGLIVVGVGGLATLLAYEPWARAESTEKEEASSHKPVSVTLAKVTARPVPRYVPVVGTLYGQEEIEISARVDGPVARVYFDIGDPVKEGDLLFEIDPTDYALAVAEAERALDLERAKLGRYREQGDDIDVTKLPAVIDADLRREQSRRDYERAQQLWNQRTITKEEWEKAETELKRAEAAHAKAIDDAQAGIAAMRQKEAMLESARKRLADTRVVVPAQPSVAAGLQKPIEYVVAERNVTEGEMISAMRGGGLPAFRLVIADPLKLEAAVGERYASEVRAGQDAGILTEATGNRMFPAKVSRVNPTVDRVSRTFRVDIQVPNAERHLPPGSFGKGLIQTKVDPDATTVPAESIVRFAGVVKVFVVRGGKAVDVPVKIGERVEVPEGDKVRYWLEVMGPLEANEDVVTSGQSQLANDVPVVVRAPHAKDETTP